MENYSYPSYPGSGGSSPRSREIEFENPPPWEDQPPSHYKVKFMCSYGGKIQPRPNDNQLSYIGGETKILVVERSIKFASFIAKLSALCVGESSDVSFKYQLPGEDLDALISVTSDDDLEHMMTEYDRLHRASPKPARLRLFVFSAAPPAFASAEGKLDQDRFVDALNSGPNHPPDPAASAATVAAAAGAGVAAPFPVRGAPNNVDFLLGLEKGNANTNPPPVKLRDPAMESAAPVPEIRVGLRHGEDRIPNPDPNMVPVDIQRHIQDLQRLQLQDQGVYRRKGDENFVGVYGGDYYVQKLPEKVPPPVNMHGTAPAAVPISSPYWQEKQISGGVGVGVGGGFPATGGGEQVYMIPAGAAGMYQPPVGRPVTNQPAQGYYQVPRVSSDVYAGEQQAQQYGLYAAQPPPAQQQASAMLHQAGKAAVYSDGVGVMRQVGGGMGAAAAADMGYAAQVGYDSAGRQVLYTAAYPAGMAGVSADLRVGPGAAPGQEGKIAGGGKVSQTL